MFAFIAFMTLNAVHAQSVREEIEACKKRVAELQQLMSNPLKECGVAKGRIDTV